MSTTLTNGLKLPDKGSVDWYADMQNNYAILDGAVGTVAEHTSQIAGKAPAVHTHTKSDVTDLFNSANTWSDTNTYSVTGDVPIKITNGKDATNPSATEMKDIRFSDVNGKIIGGVRHSLESGGTAKMHLYSRSFSSDGSSNSNHGLLIVNNKQTGVHEVQSESNFIPSANNSYDLGTSDYKWKTLNGINPGALSLPDMDSTVSRATELATAIDKTQTANSWTADFTGILRITWFVKNLTGPFRCSVSNNSDIRYATWGQTFSANDVWYFIVSFPVQNGKTYYFDNSFTRTSEDTSPIVYGASAVYCLGNV